MKKVGILGTGQLCLMMADAAKQLDLEIIPFGEQENALLDALTDPVYASFKDADKLLAFLENVDVVTFETESIALEGINPLTDKYPHLSKKFSPSLDALKVFQHRLHEKMLLSSLDLPVVKYMPISDQANLDMAALLLGFPMVIKTCMGGYDGKGQAIANNLDELRQAWQELNHSSCIAEQFIRFEKEISITAARDQHQNVVAYPVSTNYHRDGILRVTSVDGSSPYQAEAENIITAIMERLDYIGCMTVEFFVHDNQLIINEVAPRVHNSGHWTIDACEQSQFLLHINAITGASLKQMSSKLPMVMMNCIGEIPPDINTILTSTVKLYDYGKTPRENRKVGHINFLADNFETLNPHQFVDHFRAQAHDDSITDFIQTTFKTH